MMMVNEVIAELNSAAKSSAFLYPCGVYCAILIIWYPASSVGDFCVTRYDCDEAAERLVSSRRDRPGLISKGCGRLVC